jgi:hypothetical protein
VCGTVTRGPSLLVPKERRHGANAVRRRGHETAPRRYWEHRVVFERAKNQLLGRADNPSASLTAIDRIEVMRTGGTYGVALSINGKQFRPSVSLLTFRNRAEAIWMAEQLSDFVGAPIQTL